MLLEAHICKSFPRSYASILVAPVERDQDSLPTIVSDSDEEFDKGPEESSQLR